MINLQVFCMVIAGAVCLVSALDWFGRADYASTIAFAAFGIGYLGLAAEFWRITP